MPTQWLPQLVMAQTEDWFGLAGVAWLSGLLFLSLALTVYWACRRQAEPLVSVFLVLLTLVACTPGMSMRPQQISYLLVVVTTAAWMRGPGVRPHALGAGPAHLGVDHVPRDVAGRDRHRRRGRRSASRSTAPTRARCCSGCWRCRSCRRWSRC